MHNSCIDVRYLTINSFYQAAPFSTCIQCLREPNYQHANFQLKILIAGSVNIIYANFQKFCESSVPATRFFITICYLAIQITKNLSNAFKSVPDDFSQRRFSVRCSKKQPALFLPTALLDGPAHQISIQTDQFRL